MKKFLNVLTAINLLVIASICMLNYFYQSNGFDFTLKCVCSGLFALLGLINLGYALARKLPLTRFYVAMFLGLVLAFLGDYLIGVDFIIGAATFALGHVCFVVAYCLLQGLKPLDYAVSGGLFLGCLLFLTLCPWLTFDPSFFRIVCIVYSLIISCMLGKAVGNFIRHRNPVTGTIAVASALFFFSDLMLVFDWFIGRWDWTSNACMGTYYPALCLLALSMCLHIRTADRR